MYWYDLWDSENGNFGYVETNADSEQMEKLEKEFMESHPRLEDEEDTEYLNRFLIEFLPDKGVSVKVVNRPSQTISLDLNQ